VRGRPVPGARRTLHREPAYFKHITGAARGLMERLGVSPEDYDYAVFHQPNGKFPVRVSKKLGFTRAQIEPGLIRSPSWQHLLRRDPSRPCSYP